MNRIINQCRTEQFRSDPTKVSVHLIISNLIIYLHWGWGGDGVTAHGDMVAWGWDQ